MAAQVSDATVSRIERGRIAGTNLDVVRRVAAALDTRVELLPRSRGADFDRLVNAAHTAMAESVLAWLGTFPGWTSRPEVSFAWYGERGVIDVVAWHQAAAALLEIELKTEIVDIGELLGTVDRRRRLGSVIARQLGWEPTTTSSLLIIAESDRSRRRVRAHATTFASALPARIVEVRRWLQAPTNELRGLIFFADRRSGSVARRLASQRRVHRARGVGSDAECSPVGGELGSPRRNAGVHAGDRTPASGVARPAVGNAPGKSI